MDRERWHEIDRIFASVLERPPGERAAFLDKACNRDEELRKEVESLLAHDQARSFMEVSALAEAARLVVKDDSTTRWWNHRPLQDCQTTWRGWNGRSIPRA